MLSGFCTIASGILTRQREIDTIGNNLVNAQTPGYRSKRMVMSAFEQELMTRKDANSRSHSGSGVTAVVVDDVVTNHEPGMLTKTDRVFDAAISGEGFFTVEGEGGELFSPETGTSIWTPRALILPGVGRVQANTSDKGGKCRL